MRFRFPLAWHLLLREWRGGEFGLLFAALVLGVAMVTGINLFAERLQRALVGEASAYLGADRVLQVTDPLPNHWLDHARHTSLNVATTAVFPTMVYPHSPNNSASVLASLKAVSATYPLRGTLEVRDNQGRVTVVQHGPAKGMAWVDANILNQLDVALGDTIDIGNHPFLIERILTREGDAGSSFYGMGMRVMINEADLASTGLVIPGSRVEYRYLFTGESTALDDFFHAIHTQLPKGARVITLQDNQPGIASALDKAALFLRLAGSLGVLLATLAAGFAAQRYCQRHAGFVAIMKTLGASKSQILRLLAGQMAGLWLLATMTGFLPGLLLQQAFLSAMGDWVPASTSPFLGWRPFFMGAATSLICLVAFIWPTFLRLANTPPWLTLRTDPNNTTSFAALWPAIPGISLLLLLYTQHLMLSVLLLGGTLALALLSGLLGWALLLGGKRLGKHAGNIWRLGIANILRQRWMSLLQVAIFSIGFMLLTIMVLLRGSLLQEWRMQIPAGAPNVFLINIAPNDVERLHNDLAAIHLSTSSLYPMVRGRLTTINNQLATTLFDESVNAVYRELNLSWSANLPPDNTVTEGAWPGVTNNNTHPVSIEQGLAKKLHLKLGDQLSFSIGSDILSAQITSIRVLNWDKMTPNFYFLFPPGVLDAAGRYNATWITSLHRNETQEQALSRLLRRYPSIIAYPVDELLTRVQAIVERVGLAVEVILLLVLLAGFLVLLTCLRASLDHKLRDCALLRTLGAGKTLILGSLVTEFSVIGAVAGLLAAIGAELTTYGLQVFVFKMEFVPHPLLWITIPLLTTLAIGCTGTVFCYRVLRIPPIIVLREVSPPQ